MNTEDKIEKDFFPKSNSLALKGIAIIMMMWHHCFLKGRFEKFNVNFWPLMQSQVVNIAAFFKICVSLFAFISGYGLYKSYIKDDVSIGMSGGGVQDGC